MNASANLNTYIWSLTAPIDPQALAIHPSRQIKVHTMTMLGLFRQDSEHSEEMYGKSEGLA